MLEKRQIERQIEVLLAGRAAELLVGGEDAVTAGAANDLSRAAELAVALVMDLGMAGGTGRIPARARPLRRGRRRQGALPAKTRGAV